VVVGSGVSCTNGSQSRTINGVQVETLDEILLRHNWERFADFKAMPSLRRYMAGAWAAWEQAGRGEGADLIEVTDWGFLFLPAILESQCPVIAQLHGSTGQIDLKDPVRGEEAYGHVARLLEAVGLSRADRLQTYSHANAQFWRRQTNRPVVCIRPCWSPLLVSDRVAKVGNRGLAVGRVQRWKGPHVLCKAVRLRGERAPSIDWVGTGSRASFAAGACLSTGPVSFPWKSFRGCCLPLTCISSRCATPLSDMCSHQKFMRASSRARG
jgi:hypothetical protein